MIAKAQRGANLAGLMRYLFGKGRAEEHTNQRVVACSDQTWVGTAQPDRDQLRQMIAELDDAKVRHGDRTSKGYVYHVPISIEASAGSLSDDQWRDVAATFARKLNLDEGVSWVAVHHGRSVKGNDHIHLVVNLIKDNGREVNLSWDRVRMAEARAELEKKYGLTSTAAPGHGVAALSRAEVDRVRAREAVGGTVEDLARHRLATLVRGVATGVRSEEEFVARLRGEGVIVSARYAKGDRASVTGYRVALKGGPGEAPLWFGGGTLGKDLRLPALRSRWQEAGAPPGSSVWEGTAGLARKANAEHVAAASDALGEAGRLMARVPVEDRDGWARLTSDAAGVLAAAAAATPNVVLQRELTRAWQSVNRCVRSSESAAEAGTVASESAATDQASAQVNASESAIAWRGPVRFDRPISAPSREASTLLAGASRVLMASRMGDAPSHARVAALIAQAAQLAAQIARTAAARADATAAERRAVAACEAAAATALWPVPVASMWQYPPRSPAEAAELQETQTPIEQAPDGVASRPEPGLDR